MAQFTRAGAQKIAQRLGGDENFTLAIADVESGGRSDLPDGRPQILEEALWFHKFTNGVYDLAYPSISSPIWDKKLYIGGAGEYTRFYLAESLNKIAAKKATSWGLFQFMGFNFDKCGFSNVDDFVEFIKGPDDNDMEAFVNFVNAQSNLLSAYRNQDSRAFAAIYNGSGQIEYYADKIDVSTATFRGGREVHQVNDYGKMQEILGIPVTGVWDDKTLYAILMFQKDHGLNPDGIVGPMTRRALGL